MNNIVNDVPGLKHIEKMYENLSYFDQYGGSVINLVLITIVLFLVCAYCYAMIKASEIRANWQTEKCKPQIIPFAGFINAPSGTTWYNYTYQNFNQCLYNIQSSISGEILEPVTFITNLMSSMISEVESSVNAVRGMFDNVRTAFGNVAKEIMGRIMNVMIPLQQIIIALKDFMGKTQAVLTTGLYTSLGAFYTLQSLMGAIAQFIIMILIALAIIMIALWVVPFTWGAAAAMTAVFLGISIPMIIILAFMLDYLKVKPDLSIPKIKCFDKETMLILNDGTKTKISEINVGDILEGDNTVTALIKVTSENSTMYTLNEVIVSDSHIVKYMDNWIKVSDHPSAVKLCSYDKEHLYCLNTHNKTIVINNTLFADWDDLYGTELDDFLRKHKLKTTNDIHTHLDYGFTPQTSICLENGKQKKITDIKIGDILKGNIEVYGVVELDGAKQQRNLGNMKGNEQLNNMRNVCNLDKYYNKYLDDMERKNKLYHLLTTKQMFYINGRVILDYNACIDLYLDKHRINLLSMKYV